MTDPFSIIAGVLSITTATIQSSKVFLRLVNDIKEGPEEIGSVSRDVHAFHTIIVSLNTTLEDTGVKNAISCDDALLMMLGTLSSPLENCQSVLGQLMVKIQQQLKPCLGGKRLRMNTKSVRWCFSTKSEIRGLQLRLEATKATLCSALDAFTALCSVRLLVIANVAASQLVKWSNKPMEASSTIRRLVEESLLRNIDPNPSRRRSTRRSFSHPDADLEDILPTPRRQVLSSLTSFVEETQHAFMSEDSSLHRHFARIYRELGEHRMHMAQLTTAINQSQEPNHGSLKMSNCGTNIPGEPANPMLSHGNESDDGDDDDFTAVDLFFDCVSRCSTNDSSSSIDRLYANFSGSPDYHFESAPSFYPEQYTADSLFGEKILTVAMKVSTKDYRTQKYFLLYAETPRKWRRIILSATFSSAQEKSALLQLSVTDNNDYSCKILPRALQRFLSTFIPQLQLLSSVSSLSLCLRGDQSGQIVTESPVTEVVEDLLEKELSDEEQVLQDIEDLGCERFLECEVMVKSRITSSCYHVWVGHRDCVERKSPFASAGKEGDNGFLDFFNDLKLLNSLRGCAGIAQLIGVVLDETRRHLRSYLYEAPAIISLKRLISFANSKSETIPWPIREMWSSQIVKAFSNVHSRGLIVGVVGIESIGVRADGTAVLTRLQTSPRHLIDVDGHVPPELRSPRKRDEAAQPKVMNFRTDIFQLGYILWLLAEHKSYLAGYLCAKAACTNFPRSACEAEHVNPVELPACRGRIPQNFSNIIRACRSSDPKARPTALSLAEAMPTESTGCLSGINELLDASAPSVNYFLVSCDECGAVARNMHYHCNICRWGNFDLCSTCVERGVHCRNPEHRLVKRILKHGEYVDGS